ncbi:XdhC family protein [Pseudomaricurvus alkylphenolicus]|uniref:XdhC family protein n=1 Tax=Pseudomaricurvus alkylphenolicus TaxID=1306991 RepID=UPI00141F4FDF|nr:XdhC family protein [Pseudomaricurvus alkylphenolicus]
MQTTQLEVLQAALEGLNRGVKVTLVSVAQTWGTSPRPVGSLLVVCSDGHFAGSVSGGCVEEDLFERLIESPPTQPEVTLYGETEEERHRFGLPCGGTLALILEPFSDVAVVQALIDALHQRRTLTRTLCIETGDIQLGDSQDEDIAHLTETHWVNIFGPVWRLLIIGAGQTSSYLAEMANALGYRVLISDPRPEYRQDWSVADTELLEGYPDDVVRAVNPDRRTAIVALTHDPKLDDLALLDGLRSEAFYVGALGSLRTTENRRQRLKEHFEFTDEELDRLRGPVGLPIGSKAPPEIALAVLAELTALRNGIDIKAQLQSQS